jgi:hypothetical protein
VTKDISIDPDHLSKGGNSLQKLGSELENGGGKLADAGQRMAQHAAQDKSGLGKVFSEFFGRATQIAGDVIKEGGRVVKKSGQHLHESGQSHRENDNRSKTRFDKIKPDPKAPNAKGGAGHTGKTGGPHSPRNLGSSWHDDIKKHFSPKEQQELQHAMDKLSAPPNGHSVPGSGQLTQHERELLARAQKHVNIDANTPMQKVIPAKDLPDYLSGKYNSIGGFVARQQDAAHLNTPDKVVDGMRLDYRNTPFHQGMPKVHAIEFPATHPNQYKIPFGAPSDPNHGFPDNHPSVVGAANQMHHAGQNVGLDPKTFSPYSVNEYPWGGAGVTAHPTLGIPEREMPARMPIPNGSLIVEYDPAGNRVVTHQYDDVTKAWIPV